jgi:proteasome assembly chaperone (PAC2) family protein
MASTVISFRLPQELYEALLAEKQLGESDGTAAIRLLGERLGYIAKATGYIETLTVEKAEEMIAVEVDRRLENVVNTVNELLHKMEALEAELTALKAPVKKPSTPRTSSGRKLTKDSTKNP